MAEYLIGKHDMATVYISPDPYFEAFEDVIDLRKFDLKQHRTAGLCLAHVDGRLFLGSMTPGTPGAKIPRWRSRLKGAWLIKVGNTLVSSTTSLPALTSALCQCAAAYSTNLDHSRFHRSSQCAAA